MRKLRVALLYGGTSEEHEVSVVSARSVLEAIDRDRYDIVPIAITKSGRWLAPSRAPDELPTVAGSLPAVRDDDGNAVMLERAGDRAAAVRGADAAGPVDVVFPLLHGVGGEDGSVQGLLEVLGIPYVGAGVAASAVGMDKALQKLVLAAAGIPVTPWVAVRARELDLDTDAAVARAVDVLGLPAFVKPSNGGSSVGVSKCRTADDVHDGLREAFRHDRVALVERAIDGRELECAVLGNDDPEASVVGEVIPAHEFYDYEAKYLVDGSELVIPARVDERVSERVRAHSVEAFRAIGCAGMARVDFFLDRRTDELFLNEINTIPGFTPISMYPKLWDASGLPYAKLIDRLIDLALERHA